MARRKGIRATKSEISVSKPAVNSKKKVTETEDSKESLTSESVASESVGVSVAKSTEGGAEISGTDEVESSDGQLKRKHETSSDTDGDSKVEESKKMKSEGENLRENSIKIERW